MATKFSIVGEMNGIVIKNLSIKYHSLKVVDEYHTTFYSFVDLTAAP